MNANCPNCGQKIGLLKRFRFSNWFGMRRSRPCPHCGQYLTWSKWPWWLINGGFYLLIIAGVIGGSLAVTSPESVLLTIMSIATLISVFVFLIGSVFHRFEIQKENRSYKE
jgi:hypothetical protein